MSNQDATSKGVIDLTEDDCDEHDEVAETVDLTTTVKQRKKRRGGEIRPHNMEFSPIGVNVYEDVIDTVHLLDSDDEEGAKPTILTDYVFHPNDFDRPTAARRPNNNNGFSVKPVRPKLKKKKKAETPVTSVAASATASATASIPASTATSTSAATAKAKAKPPPRPTLRPTTGATVKTKQTPKMPPSVRRHRDSSDGCNIGKTTGSNQQDPSSMANTKPAARSNTKATNSSKKKHPTRSKSRLEDGNGKRSGGVQQQCQQQKQQQQQQTQRKPRKQPKTRVEAGNVPESQKKNASKKGNKRKRPTESEIGRANNKKICRTSNHHRDHDGMGHRLHGGEEQHTTVRTDNHLVPGHNDHIDVNGVFGRRPLPQQVGNRIEHSSTSTRNDSVVNGNAGNNYNISNKEKRKRKKNKMKNKDRADGRHAREECPRPSEKIVDNFDRRISYQKHLQQQQQRVASISDGKKLHTATENHLEGNVMASTAALPTTAATGVDEDYIHRHVMKKRSIPHAFGDGKQTPDCDNFGDHGRFHSHHHSSSHRHDMNIQVNSLASTGHNNNIEEKDGNFPKHHYRHDRSVTTHTQNMSYSLRRTPQGGYERIYSRGHTLFETDNHSNHHDSRTCLPNMYPERSHSLHSMNHFDHEGRGPKHPPPRPRLPNWNGWNDYHGHHPPHDGPRLPPPPRWRDADHFNNHRQRMDNSTNSPRKQDSNCKVRSSEHDNSPYTSNHGVEAPKETSLTRSNTSVQNVQRHGTSKELTLQTIEKIDYAAVKDKKPAPTHGRNEANTQQGITSEKQGGPTFTLEQPLAAQEILEIGPSTDEVAFTGEVARIEESTFGTKPAVVSDIETNGQLEADSAHATVKEPHVSASEEASAYPWLNDFASRYLKRKLEESFPETRRSDGGTDSTILKHPSDDGTKLQAQHSTTELPIATPEAFEGTQPLSIDGSILDLSMSKDSSVDRTEKQARCETMEAPSQARRTNDGMQQPSTCGNADAEEGILTGGALPVTRSGTGSNTTLHLARAAIALERPRSSSRFSSDTGQDKQARRDDNSHATVKVKLGDALQVNETKGASFKGQRSNVRVASSNGMLPVRKKEESIAAQIAYADIVEGGRCSIFIETAILEKAADDEESETMSIDDQDEGKGIENESCGDLSSTSKARGRATMQFTRPHHNSANIDKKTVTDGPCEMTKITSFNDDEQGANASDGISNRIAMSYKTIVGEAENDRSENKRLKCNVEIQASIAGNVSKNPNIDNESEKQSKSADDNAAAHAASKSKVGATSDTFGREMHSTRPAVASTAAKFNQVKPTLVSNNKEKFRPQTNPLSSEECRPLPPSSDPTRNFRDTDDLAAVHTTKNVGQSTLNDVTKDGKSAASATSAPAATTQPSHPTPTAPKETRYVFSNKDSFAAAPAASTQATRPTPTAAPKETRYIFSNKDSSKKKVTTAPKGPKPRRRPPERKQFNLRYDTTEDALEAQERLFREAAARVRANGQAHFVSDSQPANHQLPVFLAPLVDVASRYPDHWKYVDHFTRLGLPKGAPLQAIKSQYRKLALIYHPDKSKLELASTKFQAITEAYRSLVGR